MKSRLLLATVALVLAACGDPVATDPAGDGPATDPATGEGLVVAPRCEDLDAVGGEVEGERPATPGDQRVELGGDIDRWARSEAAGDYGGLWMAPPGSGRFTVAFTRDVDAYQERLDERFGDGIRVVEVARSMAELEALQDEIVDEMGSDTVAAEDRFRPPPGTVITSGISPNRNRVALGVVGGDDAALAEVTARYGADRICLELHQPHDPVDPDGPVRPLAKAGGWRDGLDRDVFALAEIAYDAATAERAWRENVPEDLPERDGDPIEEGVYADLGAVDFETHAVVVWSAGQSGSCPGWLADIGMRDGELVVERGAAGVGVCTDDYNPYRMVLAVERDRLPDPGELPQEARANGSVTALVTAYP